MPSGEQRRLQLIAADRVGSVLEGPEKVHAAGNQTKARFDGTATMALAAPVTSLCRGRKGSAVPGKAPSGGGGYHQRNLPQAEWPSAQAPVVRAPPSNRGPSRLAKRADPLSQRNALGRSTR